MRPLSDMRYLAACSSTTARAQDDIGYGRACRDPGKTRSASRACTRARPTFPGREMIVAIFVFRQPR